MARKQSPLISRLYDKVHPEPIEANQNSCWFYVGPSTFTPSPSVGQPLERISIEGYRIRRRAKAPHFTPHGISYQGRTMSIHRALFIHYRLLGTPSDLWVTRLRGCPHKTLVGANEVRRCCNPFHAQQTTNKARPNPFGKTRGRPPGNIPLPPGDEFSAPSTPTTTPTPDSDTDPAHELLSEMISDWCAENPEGQPFATLTGWQELYPNTGDWTPDQITAGLALARSRRAFTPYWDSILPK